MAASLICFIILVLFTIVRSQVFTIDNPPRAVGAAACATNKNSIFIMGGDAWGDGKQFVEYNSSSDVMVDHGPNELPQNVFGIAMYFSQHGNSLYYMNSNVDPQVHSITVYDLSSPLFPSNTSAIQKGTSNIFGASACIAASEHFLFVLGGYEGDMLTILNVLSLPGHVWSLGPEMITKRVNQGCVVMPDNYLYAIAGATPQNERISINNLQDQTWHLIDPLTETVGFHGIAPYQGVIWVFGGRDASNLAVYFNKIWNIYTEDGSVALLPESLPFNFSLTSGTMTIVHNIVYLFGEQSMKYVIHPSDNPTKTPTDNPSEPSTNQTDNPSLNPSKMPSDTPSKWPTISPSNEPSITPTNTPTDAPSSVPTFVPIATTDIEQEHTQHSALKPPKSSGINSITVIIIIVCVLAFFICMIVLIYRVARCIWFENDKKITSKENDGNDDGGIVSGKLQGDCDTRTVAIMDMEPRGVVMRGNVSTDDNEMIQSGIHRLAEDNNKNEIQIVQSEEGNMDYEVTSGDNNQNGVKSKENDSDDQIKADIDGIRDENEDEDWIESLYVKKHNCDETTTGTRSHDHNHTEQQQIIAVEGLPQNGHESNDSQDHVAMGYTNEGPDGIQIMNEKGVMQGAAKVTKHCVSASHDTTQ
eukprot:459322_1